MTPHSAQSGEPASHRPLVVVFRLALLLLATVALAAALLLGSRDSQRPSRAHYLCPMHAEVTSSVAGICPICGMDLELMSASVASSATKASTYQTYDTARRRAYGPDTPAPAWVDDDGTVIAILYIDELASRAPEERAVFAPSSVAGSAIAVRRSTEAPEPWDRSTRRARFLPDSSALAPRPGDVGWLRRATRSAEPPVIPYSAVLEDGDGSYVLAVSNDGRMLTKRPVEIGRVFGGVAAVLSGLRHSERVLMTSAFFLDAERRLRREATIEVAPR